MYFKVHRVPAESEVGGSPAAEEDTQVGWVEDSRAAGEGSRAAGEGSRAALEGMAAAPAAQRVLEDRLGYEVVGKHPGNRGERGEENERYRGQGLFRKLHKGGGVGNGT